MGGGYLTTFGSYQGSTITMSGGAISFATAVGGAIVTDLILYGEFSMMMVPSPHMSGPGGSGTASGETMGMYSGGPGVAYFYAPANAYLSASVTFSGFDLSDDKTNEDLLKGNGVGSSIVIGKEWWISSDWSLGTAFRLQYASMKLENHDVWMTALGFGLCFSATFN
jgi:hypothetical protein